MLIPLNGASSDRSIICVRFLSDIDASTDSLTAFIETSIEHSGTIQMNYRNGYKSDSYNVKNQILRIFVFAMKGWSNSVISEFFF